MSNELIVLDDIKVIQAKVEWDRTGIMDTVRKIADEYKDLVFNEDSLKDAKDVCADLNKLKKRIDDEKKRLKKLLTEDVKIFEAEIKEVIQVIDEAYNPIKGQIDGFEQARQDEKRNKVQKIIDELIEEQGLREEYQTDMIVQSSYLNKSTSIKSIKDELTQIATAAGLAQDEYDKNVKLIEEMVTNNNNTFGVNLVASQYMKLLDTMSVPEIMMEITKDAQSAVPKEEPKTMNEYVEQVNSKYDESPDDGDDEIFKEIYEVESTDCKLEALEQYMESNGIKFKVVE